jgi:hypothetical protein
VSVLALLLGGFNLWDARQVQRLNQDSVRPAISFDSASHPIVRADAEKQLFIALGLSNVGHSTAKINKLKAFPLFDSPSPCLQGSDMKRPRTWNSDIPPGVTNLLVFTLNLPSDCRASGVHGALVVEVSYSDTVGMHAYEQSFTGEISEAR